ncbi:uncharacterized protein N0V89_003664 [Didymosphaeria variabile]|uniref:Uncharacterized protein n=1 Tax=Didymosphaeria variabile TaxID=1932322 RepID=A0A9W9CBQ3_9PLEO|nr:uncharacterized protein N0V89_003664 [Didymosphaeria variabile]KAJ4355644.1 hypothetical protein N0V89_003664 [Didymosphaeria variabile]
MGSLEYGKDGDTNIAMENVGAESTEPFRFMDLPKEARLMVYERIPVTTKTYGASLGEDRPVVQHPERVRSDGRLILVHKTLPTGILRVSKAVHYEARPIVRAKLKDQEVWDPRSAIHGGDASENRDSFAEATASATNIPDKKVESDIMRRFGRQLRNRRKYLPRSQREWITVEVACVGATEFSSDLLQLLLRLRLREAVEMLGDKRLDIAIALRMVPSLPGTLTEKEEQDIFQFVDEMPASQMAAWSVFGDRGGHEPWFEESTPIIKGRPIEQHEWEEEWEEGMHFREHGADIAAAGVQHKEV